MKKMKTKIILLLLFTFTFFSLKAQDNEEYSVFLNNALEAVEKKDTERFNKNLKWFTVALEKDNITPENIPSKYLDLYITCITCLKKIEIK